MRPTCSTPECKNLAAKASKSGYRKVCNSCHRKKFYGKETCRFDPRGEGTEAKAAA